jgi:GNAT superfamily N-acetyltransferase
MSGAETQAPTRIPRDIRISEGSPRDVNAIIDLLSSEGRRVPDPIELHEMLSRWPSAIARHTGRLIGIFYSRSFAPDVIELRNTFVASNSRRQGIATHLEAQFAREARARGYRAMIGVNSRSQPGATDLTAAAARAFWTHRGWAIVFATDASVVVAKHL